MSLLCGCCPCSALDSSAYTAQNHHLGSLLLWVLDCGRGSFPQNHVLSRTPCQTFIDFLRHLRCSPLLGFFVSLYRPLIRPSFGDFFSWLFPVLSLPVTVFSSPFTVFSSPFSVFSSELTCSFSVVLEGLWCRRFLHLR